MKHINNDRENGNVRNNKKIMDLILEYISPQDIYCILCNSIINRGSKYSLCSNCYDHIRWSDESVCSLCGKTLRLRELNSLYLKVEKLGELYCPHCSEHGRSFNRNFSVAGYDLFERRLISKFKVEKQVHIGYNIAEMMRDELIFKRGFDLGQISLISSVPISMEKLKQRGFNQSEIIAKALANLVEKPYRNLLVKRKNTRNMKQLSAFDRKLNIEHALSFDKKYRNSYIEGKNILIVDDVFTTGATLEASSKILKTNGAKKIFTVVFATGW